MAGKFKYHFKAGFTMVDRNKFKTMKEAQDWARSHNRGASPSERVDRVSVNTPRKPVRKQSSAQGYAFGMKIKPFRF